MTHEDFAEFIREEHKLTRLSIESNMRREAEANRTMLKEIYQTNHELQVKLLQQGERHHNENKQLLKQIHRDNQASNVRFEKLLEKIIKPGDN